VTVAGLMGVDMAHRRCDSPPWNSIGRRLSDHWFLLADSPPQPSAAMTRPGWSRRATRSV